ncbi:MAG: hypothetical protein IPK80_25835 [Nannocystis sp.]|nr:hypothetical protein [Nannocystis sp.]
MYGAWNEGPLFKTPAYTWSPGLPREAAARGVVFSGFYGPEKFTRDSAGGRGRRGWLALNFRRGQGGWG